MTFPAEYLLSVCPYLLALGGLFAFSAGRRGWLKAALTGLGLALPLGYAAAKAGFLCFFLQAQLARWGFAALVLPRADAFSFVGGFAGKMHDHEHDGSDQHDGDGDQVKADLLFFLEHGVALLFRAAATL